PHTFFILVSHPPLRSHPSFPTRRSCDLLNAEHAFINPAMILLYIPDRRAENVVLSIPNPPENWRAASATGIESPGGARTFFFKRSEEHTSELQSRGHLVCRLLLEKKKKN